MPLNIYYLFILFYLFIYTAYLYYSGPQDSLKNAPVLKGNLQRKKVNTSLPTQPSYIHQRATL